MFTGTWFIGVGLQVATRNATMAIGLDTRSVMANQRDRTLLDDDRFTLSANIAR